MDTATLVEWAKHDAIVIERVNRRELESMVEYLIERDKASDGIISQLSNDIRELRK